MMTFIYGIQYDAFIDLKLSYTNESLYELSAYSGDQKIDMPIDVKVKSTKAGYLNQLTSNQSYVMTTNNGSYEIQVGDQIHYLHPTLTIESDRYFIPI